MATTIRMLMVSKYLEKRSKTFRMLVSPKKQMCIYYIYFICVVLIKGWQYYSV